MRGTPPSDAEDHILEMCSLLERDEVPVFAHVVVARAAIDASLHAFVTPMSELRH